MEREREKIELTNDEHHCLSIEGYIGDVDFKEIEEVHEGTGRHQEYYSKVWQRESDNKFFKVYYSTSIKDSMGWQECNENSAPHSAMEVFPVETVVTKYV